MPPKVIKIVVFTDIICPFCYIGHKELQTAIESCQNLPVRFDVQYRPYLLVTDIPEGTTIDKATYYKSKLGPKFETHAKAVQENAERVGLDISLTDGFVSPTNRAHRLIVKSYQIGGQKFQLPIVSAIYQAFCSCKKDIGDVNVLAQISQTVGVMPKEETVRFLLSDELKEDVERMAADAKTVGFKGVPITLIDGKWAMGGAQPAEAYIKIFEKLASERASSSLPPVPQAVTV